MHDDANDGIKIKHSSGCTFLVFAFQKKPSNFGQWGRFFLRLTALRKSAYSQLRCALWLCSAVSLLLPSCCSN